MKSQPAVPTTLLLIALVTVATSLTLVQAACSPDLRCRNDDYFGNTLFPHSSDCAMYYRCDAGMACEKSCPPGLHFSHPMGRCVSPGAACCDIDYSCKPAVCSLDARCPNESFYTLLPHDRSCAYYYVCYNGIACEESCPHGQHFSASTARCEAPETACCDPNFCYPATCAPDARCPSDDYFGNTLLPHNRSCAHYYRCHDGLACEESCPPGLHFSLITQRCEAPETACCDPHFSCNRPV